MCAAGDGGGIGRDAGEEVRGLNRKCREGG